MGLQRNGARTFLNLLHKCCRLSRLPGFRNGVDEILGGTTASSFFTVWDPVCAVVDALVGADNWYNQKDYHPDATGNEDVISPPPGV